MPVKERARRRRAEVPLALRTSGIEVTPALSEHVHGRLKRRLAKLSSQVERLSVRFEDINGPRRGVDTICRIKVVLSGIPTIVVEELASDALEAFNLADHRVERAVVRAVGKARRPSRADDSGQGLPQRRRPLRGKALRRAGPGPRSGVWTRRISARSSRSRSSA
jgi:ribosome-associated translation inhibitor RaiA